MSTGVDPIQLELMKHVERAVRPVLAPPEKKMQMRRELLAHLTELYEQELADSGDPRSAAERAMGRLGEPQALSTELQQSIPRWARTAARLNDWWRRREGEPLLRFAGRAALGTASSMAVYVVFVQCVVWVAAAIDPHKGPPFALAGFYCALVVSGAVGGFAFALLGQAMLSALRRHPGRSGLIRAAAVALLCGPIAFLLASTVVASAAGQLAFMFDQFPRLYLLLIVGPAMGLGLVLACEHERCRDNPWAELAIG